MPRKPSTDPLVTLTLRVPASFRRALEAEAKSSGDNLSDLMRRRLASSEAPPLGRPAPRRRKLSELGPVSKADPALMRQIARIGANMNQLARSANAGALAGSPIEAIFVLERLLLIERCLRELISASEGRTGAH